MTQRYLCSGLSVFFRVTAIIHMKSFFELIGVFSFFLAVLGLHCCEGPSVIAASRAYAPAALRGLLVGVASRCRAGALEWVGSVVVAVGGGRCSRAQAQ